MSYLHRVQNDTELEERIHFDPVLVLNQKEPNNTIVIATKKYIWT